MPQKLHYLLFLTCAIGITVCLSNCASRNDMRPSPDLGLNQYSMSQTHSFMPRSSDSETRNIAPNRSTPFEHIPNNTRMSAPQRRYYQNPQNYSGFSTLALDADSASYHLAKQALRENTLPNTQHIRIEEFINAGQYAYQAQEQNQEHEPLSLNHSLTRIDDCQYLLRVGVYCAATTQQKPRRITLVIDSSGSMNQENKLVSCQYALNHFINYTRTNDQIAIVRYAGKASLLCAATTNRDKLKNAINHLSVSGQSNVEEGIQLGFTVAQEQLDPDASNYVILWSDGIANRGHQQATHVLESVKQAANDGISLFTVGVGQESYNDQLMEQLANQGNGTYHYLDCTAKQESQMAQRLLHDLHIAVYNTKAQIRFNQDLVKNYQLFGYTNRALAHYEFFDQRIDGADIPHDTQVTALYQINTTRKLFQHEELNLGEVFLRWQKKHLAPEQECTHELSIETIAADLTNTDDQTQLAYTLASFASALQQPAYAPWHQLLLHCDQLKKDNINPLFREQFDQIYNLAAQASALSRQVSDRSYYYPASTNKRW